MISLYSRITQHLLFSVHSLPYVRTSSLNVAVQTPCRYFGEHSNVVTVCKPTAFPEDVQYRFFFWLHILHIDVPGCFSMWTLLHRIVTAWFCAVAISPSVSSFMSPFLIHYYNHQLSVSQNYFCLPVFLSIIVSNIIMINWAVARWFEV